MTELNKFGVTGLLRFQKGILPSHVAKFPFQILQYVQRNVSFLYTRKVHILILKVMTMHTAVFAQNLSTVLLLIIRVFGKD